MPHKLSPVAWLFTLPAFIILVSLACIDPEVAPTEYSAPSLTEYSGPSPIELAASGLKLLDQINMYVGSIAIQGNYAYLGALKSLIVVDISNPNAPRLVGQSGPLPGMIFDLALSGDYAFLGSGSGGLRVVDISDPTEPYEVSHGVDEGMVENIILSGDYAYLAINAFGIRVLDISDPYQPGLASIECKQHLMG